MTTLVDLFRSDRERPQVNDVVQVGRGALRLLVVAVVLGAAGLGIALIGRHAGFDCLPGNATTIDVEVAGTSARADPLLAACSRSQVTHPLVVDSFLFIPAYVLVLAIAQRGARQDRLPRCGFPDRGVLDGRTGRRRAGVLDEIENVVVVRPE
jgi:hypothetical protein